MAVRASGGGGGDDEAAAAAVTPEDVQLAPRPAAMTREAVLQCIRDEAPLVITREALADKFTYTPALDFPVGEGAAAYCVYMMHLRSVLARELAGYELKVTREFAPEPSKLIVRWTITWEADNGPGTVNGSSTFRLNDAGLVAAVTDQWEVEGESGTGEFFGRCFEFAMALRPGGMSALQWDSLNTAMKLAGWEALKNSPLYGGQMTREELDGLITQSMYAVGGLAVAVALLMGVGVTKLLS